MQPGDFLFATRRVWAGFLVIAIATIKIWYFIVFPPAPAVRTFLITGRVKVTDIGVMVTGPAEAAVF